MLEDEILLARKTAEAIAGLTLRCDVRVKEGEGLGIDWNGADAVICAENINALARGFFLLCRAQKEGGTTLRVAQRRSIARCGAYLDMSRGAVMTKDAVKRYIGQLAALGMNVVMLYTEDTYTVPEYPRMGYLRGRYSPDEMREMDAYAASLGVEMIPSIQTLAHLGQFLQWQENARLKDQPTVLLCDEEETYRLIEAEIKAMRDTVGSRRIHIGMDEAHGVGLGQYFAEHGPTDRFELLSRHLGRVVALCEKYDFKPIMWSDMFFRLGSQKNEYYDMEAQIPQRVIDGLPNVDLCYWDYYHTEPEMYEFMLTQHEKMGRAAFAGGIWTWSGFLPHVTLTEATMRPALKACARHHVDTALATMWGDDGAETNFFLASSQLPLFSEACWRGEDCTREEIAAMGECLTGLPAAAYEAFGKFYPAAIDRRTGKGLIWGDLLYPLLEYPDDTMRDAARRAQEALDVLTPLASSHMECAYACLLFEIVLRKAQIKAVLRDKYLAGDRDYLRQIAQEEIPALLSLYARLVGQHRALWERDCKRFGWEVLCLRYGAVQERLRDVQEELLRFLAGKLPAIVELDETPLPSERKGGMQYYQTYAAPGFSI